MMLPVKVLSEENVLKLIMNINALPTEVMENIFLNLDGHSLSRAEGVCSRWRCHIQSLQMKAGFWKRKCQDEIPTNVLEEILGYKSCEMFSDDQVGLGEESNGKLIVNWKAVYSTWCRGRMISFWPYNKMYLKTTEGNPVTCIQVSGDWVVTGHRNGSVLAWNRHTGCKTLVAQHLKMVTDFAFMDVFHIGPYVPLYSNEHEWDHHLIISVSKDHAIQVNSTCDDSGDDVFPIHFHGNCIETVKVFNSYFAVRCVDSIVSVWEVKYAKKNVPSSLSVTLVHSLVGFPEVIQWIGFWNGELQCLSVKGIRSVFCTVDKEWVIPPPPSLAGVLSNPQKSIFNIRKAFLFRESVIFVITADKLWISVDGNNFTSYSTMFCIQTSIACIALWGRLLVLGTENGRVLAYHVLKNEDLLNLNLGNPSWSQTLSAAPVIAVDVIDCAKSVVISACTAEDIFVITWYPPSNQRETTKIIGLTKDSQKSLVI